jgi:hypothetical protein
MADTEADRVWAAYEAHLAALGPPLPNDARRLWKEVSLHDGLLRAVELDEDRLDILIRAGDNQSGYFDARLTYGGASLSHDDERFLTRAVGRRDVELLDNEFDSSGKRWVHYFLFWPYEEVSVYFDTITLDVAPARGRFEDDEG